MVEYTAELGNLYIFFEEGVVLQTLGCSLLYQHRKENTMLDAIWGVLTPRQREAVICVIAALAMVGVVMVYSVATHQTCVGRQPHTVRSGDTYHTIAMAETEAGHYQVRDLRTATEAMRRMNPDISSTSLPTGREIAIPARCGDG